ncbi:dnaJ homolog subfamily C member 14-like [Clytia hemisphaerica]|uniref:J domain-containing protein n=1 Tax=Clytia hemisphaerica TaxID=252671 RepID=A0A7M5WXG8_9CNID
MILLFALKFLWAVSKKILKYTLLLILYVVATLLGFCMMINQRYQIITKLIKFTNNALEVIHLVLGIDLKGWFRRRGNRSSTKSTFDDGPPPPLPENSENAIQFLLKENPERPYRILCVSNTDSVDQIRNHYRKLVRLVHPDKCNLPQAEDAFKILDTAFKKLADPEKREEINSEMERQKAWDEFNKNMSEDYKNMFEELLNTIQCSSCEKRHKKTLVEKRTFMEARFCAECNTKHPAEDGDVWAEVGMLGVNWTCYACFDGEVYEITDWGKCQNLKQAIPVNHHRVFCHVGTQAANKSGRSRTPRNSEESGNRGTKRSKKNKRRK